MINIFKREKKRIKGFTLVEMLAVLFVMSIIFVISATPFGSIKKTALNDQLHSTVGLIEDSTSTVIRRVKDLDTYPTDESIIEDLNRYLAGSAKLELDRSGSETVYVARSEDLVITVKPDKIEDVFLLKAYMSERDYLDDVPVLKETISYSGITETP